MKKELITLANLDSHIGADGKFHVGPDTVVTAGAKDELVKRKVKIVYEGREAACGPEANARKAAAKAPCCDRAALDDLAVAVAALIRKESGVTDPAKLRQMTVEAIARIKAKAGA